MRRFGLKNKRSVFSRFSLGDQDKSGRIIAPTAPSRRSITPAAFASTPHDSGFQSADDARWPARSHFRGNREALSRSVRRIRRRGRRNRIQRTWKIHLRAHAVGAGAGALLSGIFGGGKGAGIGSIIGGAGGLAPQPSPTPRASASTRGLEMLIRVTSSGN